MPSGDERRRPSQPPGHRSRKDDADASLRLRVAAEAARLISESAGHDFDSARRKAAARLGSDESHLPTNAEIESAVLEHRRLFADDESPELLRRLRKTALDAMDFLRDFKPRLVGAVLDGSADAHSAVCLHLCSDDPDAPARLLENHRIAYRSKSRRMRMRPNDIAPPEFPALTFIAESTTIDLTVFSSLDMRQAPIDPHSGRPMKRAKVAAVEALLNVDADGISATGFPLRESD